MFHGGWYGMGIGMGWMWIFWVLVLAAIVAVLVWALAASRRSAAGRESPEEILKRRYARGDITKEQFEQMRHDLE